MKKVTQQKPDTRVDAGRHTVQIYEYADGSKTVTIGNKTGRQDGGNFGGKGVTGKE